MPADEEARAWVAVDLETDDTALARAATAAAPVPANIEEEEDEARMTCVKLDFGWVAALERESAAWAAVNAAEEATAGCAEAAMTLFAAVPDPATVTLDNVLCKEACV